ncbi:MAG: aminomethyl-transferring glycine dehydrogenase subunit GcvPA [Synergistaceae bacterium]|jgi:glycine dehydrogenase subunit 1|nr:aminomethyl-transferring glycine dehydrogenase subunit GcvPA [Synergistaceae bacterium]
MGYYVPSTEAEQMEMLAEAGFKTFDDLFSSVPDSLKIKGLDIPEGLSEFEVREKAETISRKNRIFRSIFRGAGAYNHYIPALVKQIMSREEFITAYTPYQAEISQGILQSIFEFQTMMCELTGLDVSNASVYDGASAAAEAVGMCRDRKRQAVFVSESVNPAVIRVIGTYCCAANATLTVVPAKNGVTDADKLASMLDESSACFFMQQPNYFGLIEDAAKLGEVAHSRGAKFVMGVNPIAAAILRTPAECGADVAVGEAQPLGMPLAFGGPYLGFMTATSEMSRRLPGRIVGQTTDLDGKRAFVLTLQAREQHIRREKASSNICSNQALCAMTASVYLTVLGPEGLQSAADHCLSKARYAAERITAVKGFDLLYPGEFFHEFVTSCPGDAESLLGRLEERDILGGLPVEGGILWCVTEMNTKEQIDGLVRILEEVSGK